MKKLTFADLHLRATVPSCVNATPSEWMEIQEKALDKVVEICEKNEIDEVYVGGDIFHSEQATSFECVILFQNFCRKLESLGIKVFILAGNHDLPGHSTANVRRSAIGVLFNSLAVNSMNSSDSKIKGSNFDEESDSDFPYIFKHVLCIPEESKPALAECETPQTLLEKFPKAKIIFTGDYHRNFIYKSPDGRMVVNSGCLTKQASDFENYETGVYVTDLEKGESVWFPVNVPQKFVKNGGKGNRDKSLEDFVNSIKKESVTLDFISELRERVPAQKEPVQEKVESWIEKIGQ